MILSSGCDLHPRVRLSCTTTYSPSHLPKTLLITHIPKGRQGHCHPLSHWIRGWKPSFTPPLLLSIIPNYHIPPILNPKSLNHSLHQLSYYSWQFSYLDRYNSILNNLTCHGPYSSSSKVFISNSNLNKALIAQQFFKGTQWSNKIQNIEGLPPSSSPTLHIKGKHLGVALKPVVSCPHLYTCPFCCHILSNHFHGGWGTLLGRRKVRWKGEEGWTVIQVAL